MDSFGNNFTICLCFLVLSCFLCPFSCWPFTWVKLMCSFTVHWKWRQSTWYQSWSELSSSPMPLLSSHHYGDFSIMVIGIIPCGSSFSLFMNSRCIHTPHTCTHTHTPPPCRQAIYREVITPVNDGNAELEPIKAADMTNSTPILHKHTHTHRSVSIYLSSVGGLQRQSGCVCMCLCVLYACCHDQFLLERWKADFLSHLVCRSMVYCVHACVCAASVACYVCAKCVCGSFEHIGICLLGFLHLCVCLHANVETLKHPCHCLPMCVCVPIFYT